MAGPILLAGMAHYPQERLAAAAITPGHLIEYVAAGTVRVHANAGQNAVPLFADYNVTPQRATTQNAADTPYASGESVRIIAPIAGSIILAFVAANAAAIVIGDFLESAAAGGLRKFTTLTTNHPQSIVGVALQAIDNSANAAQVRIQIQIL